MLTRNDVTARPRVRSLFWASSGDSFKYGLASGARGRQLISSRLPVSLSLLLLLYVLTFLRARPIRLS
jgi:hypothetical protein